MATTVQLETLGMLREQGWKVLGHGLDGRTLVENAQQKKFYVGADGRIVPAPATAKPTKAGHR